MTSHFDLCDTVTVTTSERDLAALTRRGHCKLILNIHSHGDSSSLSHCINTSSHVCCEYPWFLECVGPAQPRLERSEQFPSLEGPAAPTSVNTLRVKISVNTPAVLTWVGNHNRLVFSGPRTHPVCRLAVSTYTETFAVEVFEDCGRVRTVAVMTSVKTGSCQDLCGGGGSGRQHSATGKWPVTRRSLERAVDGFCHRLIVMSVSPAPHGVMSRVVSPTPG